jgi:hypothetical protein
MNEIAPGLWHWTTIHPRIGIEVSSYLAVPERVVIDPRVPDEGLDALAEIAEPVAVLLTNRHHYRDAGAFAERFGCPVRVSRAGLHEFVAGEQVEPFDPGDEVADGVRVRAVGAICPDECALYLERHRALALADAVVRMPTDGPLAFVPDHLMDDPPATKTGILAALGRLADLDVAHLLLAHGDPVIGGGGDALARFVEGSGGA